MSEKPSMRIRKIYHRTIQDTSCIILSCWSINKFVLYATSVAGALISVDSLPSPCTRNPFPASAGLCGWTLSVAVDDKRRNRSLSTSLKTALKNVLKKWIPAPHTVNKCVHTFCCWVHPLSRFFHWPHSFSSREAWPALSVHIDFWIKNA